MLKLNMTEKEYYNYKNMDAIDRIVYLNNRSLSERIKMLADIDYYEKRDRKQK